MLSHQQQPQPQPQFPVAIDSTLDADNYAPEEECGQGQEQEPLGAKHKGRVRSTSARLASAPVQTLVVGAAALGRSRRAAERERIAEAKRELLRAEAGEKLVAVPPSELEEAIRLALEVCADHDAEDAAVLRIASRTVGRKSKRGDDDGEGDGGENGNCGSPQAEGAKSFVVAAMSPLRDVRALQGSPRAALSPTRGSQLSAASVDELLILMEVDSVGQRAGEDAGPGPFDCAGAGTRVEVGAVGVGSPSAATPGASSTRTTESGRLLTSGVLALVSDAVRHAISSAAAATTAIADAGAGKGGTSGAVDSGASPWSSVLRSASGESASGESASGLKSSAPTLSRNVASRPSSADAFTDTSGLDDFVSGVEAGLAAPAPVAAANDCPSEAPGQASPAANSSAILSGNADVWLDLRDGAGDADKGRQLCAKEQAAPLVESDRAQAAPSGGRSICSSKSAESDFSVIILGPKRIAAKLEEEGGRSCSPAGLEARADEPLHDFNKDAAVVGGGLSLEQARPLAEPAAELRGSSHAEVVVAAEALLAAHSAAEGGDGVGGSFWDGQDVDGDGRVDNGGSMGENDGAGTEDAGLAVSASPLKKARVVEPPPPQTDQPGLSPSAEVQPVLPRQPSPQLPQAHSLLPQPRHAAQPQPRQLPQPQPRQLPQRTRFRLGPEAAPLTRFVHWEQGGPDPARIAGIGSGRSILQRLGVSANGRKRAPQKLDLDNLSSADSSATGATERALRASNASRGAEPLTDLDFNNSLVLLCRGDSAAGPGASRMPEMVRLPRAQEVEVLAGRSGGLTPLERSLLLRTRDAAGAAHLYRFAGSILNPAARPLGRPSGMPLNGRSILETLRPQEERPPSAAEADGPQTRPQEQVPRQPRAAPVAVAAAAAAARLRGARVQAPSSLAALAASDFSFDGVDESVALRRVPVMLDAVALVGGVLMAQAPPAAQGSQTQPRVVKPQPQAQPQAKPQVQPPEQPPAQPQVQSRAQQPAQPRVQPQVQPRVQPQMQRQVPAQALCPPQALVQAWPSHASETGVGRGPRARAAPGAFWKA